MSKLTGIQGETGGKHFGQNNQICFFTDGVYFFIEQGDNFQGIYNAGFENISIIDIAKKATEFTPAEIVVTPSNDPRSYRLNSDKLLATGFNPRFNVEYAMKEIVDAFNFGNLKEEDTWYNVRSMKNIRNLA